MEFLKKDNPIKVYTTQDLTKAVLKDHSIFVPVYTKRQVHRYIVQPRGTIFGSKGTRQKRIKF